MLFCQKVLPVLSRHVPPTDQGIFEGRLLHVDGAAPAPTGTHRLWSCQIHLWVILQILPHKDKTQKAEALSIFIPVRIVLT